MYCFSALYNNKKGGCTILSNTLLPMRQKLHRYVTEFEKNDEECYAQIIPNSEAEAFLALQIPLLDIPDPVLEEIYYFRWWTYRKHIKLAGDRHVITEFLPHVSWSGPYNTIVCPAGFHIREGRWLNDPDGWIKEYIRFWLEGQGDIKAYSTWLPYAVYEYCRLKNDDLFGISLVDAMVDFYEKREAKQLKECGLYWSEDDRDGMELSISGSGFRPTLNSYACADAYAIAYFLEKKGDHSGAEKYLQKSRALRENMETLLWDGTFYKTIPADKECDTVWSTRPQVAAKHDVKELVGYIPWYFGATAPEHENAFSYLMSSEHFFSEYGLLTAERSHPRFLETADHECLWNGYIWPFATSQTLVACAKALRRGSKTLSKETYFTLLRQYADSQHLLKEDGTRVPWIDENMSPQDGRWEARAILRQQGWRSQLGGYERGKDYNHSLFCDLILSGLLGISMEDGEITACPLIPEDWEYFRVENLHCNGKQYRITYDKDGKHYGGAQGISIEWVKEKVHRNV